MHHVNTRGTFMFTQKAIPHLLESAENGRNPHVLNISPPLNMEPRWFGPHVAYTMAKYGMSMCVLGMAAEFEDDGIGINALWPRTAVATAAVQNALGGDEMMQRSRHPDIMADAAWAVFTSSSVACTGNFFVGVH